MNSQPKRVRGCEDTTIPRILTVRAKRVSHNKLELTCTTIAGRVAATLQWPDDTPVCHLAHTTIGVLRSSGFTGLKEPLSVSNLRLVKPDGTSLALGADAPSLSEQFGVA